ncbi:MAG: TonB-dependent receptor, partial [Calditrichaeota bacterium]|nr:TonB-dependent receptor [Calditrichota bacterium]
YAESLLIRAYVDNRQGGWFPNLTWEHERGTLVAGGEIRTHRSLHWGRIQDGSSDLPLAVSGDYRGRDYIGARRYYEYKGAKDILSPYLQGTYRLLPRVSAQLSLQYVYQRYRLYDEKFIGTEFDLDYHFLNPRMGLNFTLSPEWQLFTSFARVSREPRLKNFYDAAEASTPASWGAVTPQFARNPDGSFDFDSPLVQPEKLNDVEIGLSYRSEKLRGDINLYYMDFQDEIVKSGQLDRFGQPVTGNAEQTVHAGIEANAVLQLNSFLSGSGNLTFSRNELNRYSVYDSDGSEMKLDGNPIAGFPEFLANARLNFRHRGLNASLMMQHVGKQYTDNFQNEANIVDAYTVFNGMIGCRLSRLAPLSQITLQLHIQNIFDRLYITHGEGADFFPAAERHFFVNMMVEL